LSVLSAVKFEFTFHRIDEPVSQLFNVWIEDIFYS
jgi:hypothetical protein